MMNLIKIDTRFHRSSTASQSARFHHACLLRPGFHSLPLLQSYPRSLSFLVRYFTTSFESENEKHQNLLNLTPPLRSEKGFLHVLESLFNWVGKKYPTDGDSYSSRATYSQNMYVRSLKKLLGTPFEKEQYERVEATKKIAKTIESLLKNIWYSVMIAVFLALFGFFVHMLSKKEKLVVGDGAEEEIVDVKLMLRNSKKHEESINLLGLEMYAVVKEQKKTKGILDDESNHI